MHDLKVCKMKGTMNMMKCRFVKTPFTQPFSSLPDEIPVERYNEIGLQKHHVDPFNSNPSRIRKFS